MRNQLRWKGIVIVCVLLISIAGIFGLPTSREALRENWKKNIRLGLDLEGGSHIVLQIQIQDAFKVEADAAIEGLKAALQKSSIGYGSIERNDPRSVEEAGQVRVIVKGVATAQDVEFQRIAGEVLGADWTLLPRSEDRQFGLRPEAAQRFRGETVEQSIRTFDRRINGMGIAETSIQRRGGSDGAEILIQLPGYNDPGRIRTNLQTAALLELNSVVDGPYPSTERASEAHNGALPPNTRLLREAGRTREGGETWWLLSRSPVVTGRDLRDARAERDEMTGSWETGFDLIPAAAQRFGQFTETHIGQPLAIVLDNQVLSTPRIQSRISDHGRITGAASREAASDLALNLRAGSLPAGVKLIEERVVGASLGADSIRRGIAAGIVSLLLVVLSMVAYYRGTGLNAVIGLLLNTLITVAGLSYFGATWTLPGIAGLVLSIGMAVDSNVLIFERIKEELNAAKGVGAAIKAGFDRAFVTIVDTHVTTVVASAFLFMFGSGPVRGFAVTLVVGLVANMFTAVFVSRTLFDLQLWRSPRLQRLSIGGSAPGPVTRRNIDFMRLGKLTLGISLALTVLSFAAVAGYGLKPGLDFRGGALITVRFANPPIIDDLRQTLSDGMQSPITIQATGEKGEFMVSTELAAEDQLVVTREEVEGALHSRYGDQFEIRSVDIVGPRAGAQLRSQALFATLGALGGMLIYVAFRFQWISGIAAVIATVHDVVITLGLFAWTHREIDLNVVAALLTLIGYSMNDTIVVFDRVRENQRLGARGLSFVELVNQSINQTLSRTMLTAGPTLLACLALYFLGGEVLNGIAFALLVGIVAGTYSSIFVASSLLALWNRTGPALKGRANFGKLEYREASERNSPPSQGGVAAP